MGAHNAMITCEIGEYVGKEVPVSSQDDAARIFVLQSDKVSIFFMQPEWVAGISPSSYKMASLVKYLFPYFWEGIFNLPLAVHT